MSRLDDPNIFYAYVGTQIARLRQKKKISQEALAERIGLTRSSLSNIENGRQRAALLTIAKLAECLSTSVEEFLPDHKDGPTLNDILRSHTKDKLEEEFIRALITDRMER